MILRFTANSDYLSFNTDNGKFTTSKRITEDYDDMRHFTPHVIELWDATDIWNIKAELEAQGFEETNESYVFYDGNDTCTEYNTDDLPFC